jgi:glucosamine--fructose-6-phosphate aminotransferase (isomerizing)
MDKPIPVLRISMSLITSRYLKDILDQPLALEETIGVLTELALVRQVARRIETGALRQIILTGMGSSCHALWPLMFRLASAGIPATLMETSELVYNASGLLCNENVLVVLSQSGRSAETVRLLEANNSRAYVIGITNDPESPLARSAAVRLVTRAGAEFSVSTKTYVCSLIALEWLADHLLNGDLERTRDELRSAPSAVAEYLAGWKDHVSEIQAELEGITRIYLVGRGASLATAYTGGLITKEAARFPAEGMSSAAFRHGPVEMVGPGTFLMVFEGDSTASAMNQKLAKDVNTYGAKAALVGSSVQDGAFHLPAVSSRLRPVIEILPVQMATLALSAKEGREAGMFQVAKKVTDSE